MNEDKVEETTSSGSVATSEGSDKPAFPNASIYEKYEGNEIAQRAFQINEDMSISEQCCLYDLFGQHVQVPFCTAPSWHRSQDQEPLGRTQTLLHSVEP